MSNLTKFQKDAVKNTANVKGGFFFGNSCAPAPSYCAPKPVCTPPPAPCGTGTYGTPAPKPVSCAPTLPKISFSFSFGFGGGCW